MELPERRRAILKIIVAEYIASGNPVASDVIARGHSLGISPATTRHEMASLEEDGYIVRPHTSAGGVPSDKGYRYYVECLIKESRLREEDQLAIRRFFYEAEQEPEAWARLAVNILTRKLEGIAIATLPRAQVCRFRHADLVALQDALVLLVMVLQDGEIKKRVFLTEEVVSQDQLTVWANKMNTTYQGLSRQQIERQNLDLSPIEKEIAEVITQTMEADDKHEHEQFFLDGWRHLVKQAGFVKGRRMLDLVEALEEKRVLVSLMKSLRKGSGIKVTIGNENEEQALRDCTVILSNYGVEERRGAIGVIGPTRMPYNMAIPTVDYVSAVMSDLMSRMPA
ncbi:MAG: heat-inducible transcription repressor HrcA [Chloroflexi bacterium]|nr:heat-inducible transcription repressor HrcA [Chloroflexota bacterium]